MLFGRRLPEECVLDILSRISLEDLSSVASSSKDEGSISPNLWNRMRWQLLERYPWDNVEEYTEKKESRRVSRRQSHIMSLPVAKFGQIIKLRRRNAEEVLARYDFSPSRSCVGISFLRRLLKDLWPLEINHRGSDGSTLLHAVVRDVRLSASQTLQCVRELTDTFEADPSLGNDLDFSPLMSAAVQGQQKLVLFLLQRGACPHAKGGHPNGFLGESVRPGQRRRTAAEWAEAQGHSHVVNTIHRFIDQRRAQLKRKKELAEEEDLLYTGPTTLFDTQTTSPTPRISPVSPRQKKRKRRRYLHASQRYCLNECPWHGESLGDMVACEQCDNWYHCECVHLSLSDFRSLVREAKEYVCPDCFLRDAREAKHAALTALDKEAAAALKSAQALLETIEKDAKRAARAVKHAMDAQLKVQEAIVRDTNRAAKAAQMAMDALDRKAAKAAARRALSLQARTSSHYAIPDDDDDDILHRPGIVIPPCLTAFMKSIPSQIAPPAVVTPQNSVHSISSSPPLASNTKQETTLNARSKEVSSSSPRSPSSSSPQPLPLDDFFLSSSSPLKTPPSQ